MEQENIHSVLQGWCGPY